MAKAVGAGGRPFRHNIYNQNLNTNNLYDMAQDSDRYNNYSGTQEWPEHNPNLFAGMGHGRFDSRNLMRPSNLTQDMGASMYQAGPPQNVNRPLPPSPELNPLDPNWQHQLQMQELPPRGNIDNKGFGLPSLALLKAMVPKQDDRQVALTNFYGGKGNLRDGQTIQSGLMAGYNPVSGGLLNTITAGKFGAEPTYGLQGAYDKRMGTIEKTLANKYGLTADQIQGIYAGTFDEENEMNQHTQLIQRLRDLKRAKTDELAMLNKIQTGQGGTEITSLPTDTGGKTGTGDGGFTPTGNYGATQGTRGSWTPGGTYSGGASQPNPHKNTPSGNYGAAQGTKGSWGPGAKKDGGRIGYQDGLGPVLDEEENENIFEFMRDQGVPYGEMAEGPTPFEMRVNELMDEGMSWQEAWKIASEEFGMAEGQEDSFSEEGIASIV